MWDVHYGKGSISIFGEFFAGIDKVLILVGKTRHLVIILQSFGIFLIFPKF